MEKTDTQQQEPSIVWYFFNGQEKKEWVVVNGPGSPHIFI